jgi:hypothetical protein
MIISRNAKIAKQTTFQQNNLRQRQICIPSS